MIMLVLTLLLFNVKASVTPNGPTVTNDFIKCIYTLIEKNFEDPGLLVLGSTENNSPMLNNIRVEVLKKIHHSIKYTVAVSVPSDKDNFRGYASNEISKNQFNKLASYFVILTDSFSDLSHLISNLIRSPHWNAYGKFIIFIINFKIDSNKNKEQIENIFTCLFKYNVIDVLIGIPKAGNIRNADIYGWRPYDPPKYCGHFNETAKNRSIIENACEGGNVREDKDDFYDRVPTNMLKCNINILALERQPYVSRNDDDPNIEKKLINEVLERLNFTVSYEIQNISRGERDNLGHWDGALKNIENKKKHVLLGGIFPDFDVHEDFESSTSYLADSYTWVVPRALFFPPWASLSIVFRKYLWYSMCVGFILCVISWKVLGSMSGDSAYHRSWYHCALNTCIITLGFPTYIRPVKLSLQIFFVFLNIYCIVFLTAYQTKLIAILQNPTFEQQLDTIEELVESGLKFGGTEVLHDLFANSSDPFNELIFEQWTNVDDLTAALIDVAVHRNFSVLCSRLELGHLSTVIPELYDTFGMLRYYAFDTNTFTVPAEMIARRGYPLMKSFSKTLSLFKQFGFNDRVRKDFAVYNLKRRTKLLLNLDFQRSNYKPLSILQLEGGFFVLLLGSVSGTVVLIIENIVNFKCVKALLPN